jgi:cytidine deaminase
LNPKEARMKKKTIGLPVHVYTDANKLPDADLRLLQKARETTQQAYAPYSNFHVAAAAELKNGEVMVGTNQENASYPVGICAERVLLSAISSIYPEQPVVTMAISYHNLQGESRHPISPCGICRQTLAEYEQRTHQSIRLILGGMEGEVWVIEKAGQLLPLSFTSNDLSSSGE